MIEAVLTAIEGVRDVAARPRLERCIPCLLAAIENWDGAPTADLVLAAATPKSCIVLQASDWPAIRPTAAPVSKADAALALVHAIERPDTPDTAETIVLASAVVLGAAGLAAQRADAERITGNGDKPLVIMLVEKEGTSVTLMATTVAAPTRVVH